MTKTNVTASPFVRYCKLEYAKQWQERAESAEAQLAVVTGQYTAETVAMDVSRYWVEKHDEVVRAHNAMLDRAVSAEAQLAAVRKALTNVHVINSQDSGQVVCASVVDDALALLTAPEPSAEPESCPVCKRATNRIRAESAEAQLKAVTGQYTAEDVVIILRAWRTLSGDAREAAWEEALLTPAPSPGAGDKAISCRGGAVSEPGDRAVNALVDLCLNHYRPGRHSCIVVTRRRFRDLWRLSYWCVCVICNEFVSGPYSDPKAAWKTANSLNE